MCFVWAIHGLDDFSFQEPGKKVFNPRTGFLFHSFCSYFLHGTSSLRAGHGEEKTIKKGGGLAWLQKIVFSQPTFFVSSTLGFNALSTR